MVKPLVAGNWKMNGLKDALSELEALQQTLASNKVNCDVLICPPSTLLAPFAGNAADSPIAIGGQDCHPAQSGAHTGDISAEMIADTGATYVITGHSERRSDHKERDCDVRAKTQAGWRAGLTVILCIGERLGERTAGLTLDVIKRQLVNSLPQGACAANLAIAYEPVWAIGTGLTPTIGEVEKVHSFIRRYLEDTLPAKEAEGIRILYGGSVKPDNAKELMSVANVNGALVGGASLKADDFSRIIAAYEL